MVQLAEYPLWIDEAPPPLEADWPRAFRRPTPPASLRRGRNSLPTLLHQARCAHLSGQPAAFGQAYGTLAAEFQPALGWLLTCWDHLASSQGCRFVARTPEEKAYCRGDYRLFTEKDFERLTYSVFRERLIAYLEETPQGGFEEHLRQTLWASVRGRYAALENPADPLQRKLTGYSYLRCVPYQFLNPYHHHRVYRAVRQVPPLLRKTVELYYLSFYTEEATALRIGASPFAFRRRRAAAMRAICSRDFLSHALLLQIERY